MGRWSFQFILSIFFFIFLIPPMEARAGRWSLDDEIPFVYLTWQTEDTSTRITVNFHTNRRFQNPMVYYGTSADAEKDGPLPLKASGFAGKIPGLDRSIHRVVLKGLVPGQSYDFVVGDHALGWSKRYKLRTVPNDGRPVHFVTGGDMGVRKIMGDMLRLAADTNPSFAILGGDLAYANGKVRSYEKWNIFLELWQKNMVTPDGHLIPLVVAIGNHETNKSSGNPGEKAPFYYGLFAQGLGRRSYFERQFGPHLNGFILDTGHINPHGGRQAHWLKSALKGAMRVKNTIAVYHIPLFPSHRNHQGLPSAVGRASWLPLFDKYKLTAGFENHDHTMKVTKPLKKGKPGEPGTGTVFIGDGCWGRSPRKVNKNAKHMEVARSLNHFWAVTARADGLFYSAVNRQGESVYSGSTGFK